MDEIHDILSKLEEVKEDVVEKVEKVEEKVEEKVKELKKEPKKEQVVEEVKPAPIESEYNCTKCKGTGMENYELSMICKDCNGTGKV